MDLTKFVPPDRISRLNQLSGLASEFGLKPYLVGGFVRDVLLEKPVNDFDIVIEGDAIKLGRVLVKRFGGRLTAHADFRTATWYPSVSSDEFIDLISARSETYLHPAALPTIKPGTLDEDLQRRDFTINAIAMHLLEDGVGDVVDPLNGREDLQAGLVRVTYPGSFIDDPTRLFRLFRYSVRYGFVVEAGTETLISSALEYVNELSPERLRHELDLIFEEPDFLPTLEEIWKHGILSHVKPALPNDEAALSRLQAMQSHRSEHPDLSTSGIHTIRDRIWVAWLMGLSEKEIRLLARRLHFTSNLLKQCLGAASLIIMKDSLVDLRPSECVMHLEKIPDESIQVAFISEQDSSRRQVLRKYLDSWKTFKPRTNGEALLLMGVPFGPRIGSILWRLRAAWLDGELTDDGGERKLLDEILREERKR
jgi:tRNA nucleotidyltransferase (CCA-adding enzyme)